MNKVFYRITKNLKQVVIKTPQLLTCLNSTAFSQSLEGSLTLTLVSSSLLYCLETPAANLQIPPSLFTSSNVYHFHLKHFRWITSVITFNNHNNKSYFIFVDWFIRILDIKLAKHRLWTKLKSEEMQLSLGEAGMGGGGRRGGGVVLY